MKKKMKVASGLHSRNLSHSHYTTLGFGQILPSYAQEVCAGDKLTVHPNVFSRSSALEKPCMAHLKFDNRAFYVPYHSVWKYYEDFLQANPIKFPSLENKVVLRKVPTIQMNTLAQYVMGSLYDCCEVSMSAPASQVPTEPFDFLVKTQTDSSHYMVTGMKLTSKGRRILQILQSLGYNFNWMLLTSQSDIADENLNPRPSVLPLVCFAKIIYDYYVPSNLRPSSDLDRFFTEFNELAPTSYSDTTIDVPLELIALLFDQILLYHDQNYFTSQWLYPNKPVDGVNNFQSLVAWTPYNAGSETNEYPSSSALNLANDVDNGTVSNSSEISDQLIRQDTLILMKSLRTFIMRNNLVGSRPIQRLFARFGVSAPELQLEMCQYHGSYSLDVMNIDVVSQGSDTETLGEMAGKSFVTQEQKKTFKFDCNYNGWCFILTSIDVPSTPVDGLRRNLFHITPFDFYTPEFDNSVLMASRGDELLGNMNFAGGAVEMQTILRSLGLNHTKIFGYLERYSEMKFAIDRISGDYNVPTLRSSIEGFILPRQLYDVEGFQTYIRTVAPSDWDAAEIRKFFYYIDETGNAQLYSPALLLSQEDSVQFNRIYKSRDDSADPFNVHFVFDAKATGPVKNNAIDSFISGDGHDFDFEKNGPHFN